MKIYTRKGDTGETGLYGGTRIGKDALRIEAYGNVDELNSCLGVVRSLDGIEELDTLLAGIQNDLFVLGADLATPEKKRRSLIPRIGAAHCRSLEKIIDTIDEKLPALKVFILPGGGSAASQLHFARTVCRRAERSVVRLSKSEKVEPEVVAYLNRLSDLLFVLARYANFLQHKAESPWVSPPSAQKRSKR